MQIQMRLPGRSVVTSFECTRMRLAQLEIRVMQFQMLFEVPFHFSCVVAIRMSTFPWSQLTVNEKLMPFHVARCFARIGAGSTFKRLD